MAELKIEVGNYYMTRAGFRARIYSVENGHLFPYHGAINLGGDEWVMMGWRFDGTAQMSFGSQGIQYEAAQLDIVGSWMYRPSKFPVGEPTPGPWRVSEMCAAVVADYPTGHDEAESIQDYGGYLVCESATRRNLHLIAAAPQLFKACNIALDVIGEGENETEREAVERLRQSIYTAMGIPF